MEPAVDYEERVPARHLPVDDPGDVHATLADDVAAELDDDPRLGELGADAAIEQRREAFRDGARSSGSSRSEYGIPKPPPRFR